MRPITFFFARFWQEWDQIRSSSSDESLSWMGWLVVPLSCLWQSHKLQRFGDSAPGWKWTHRNSDFCFSVIIMCTIKQTNKLAECEHNTTQILTFEWYKMFTDIICALKMNTPQLRFLLFSDNYAHKQTNWLKVNKLLDIVFMIIVKMEYENSALLSILYLQF